MALTDPFYVRWARRARYIIFGGGPICDYCGKELEVKFVRSYGPEWQGCPDGCEKKSKKKEKPNVRS